MSKKYLITAAALLGVVGVAAMLMLSRPEGAAPPLGAGPETPPDDGGVTAPPRATFESDYVVAVGSSVTYGDSLTVTLLKVDDSRCPPDVQCIWAGELSPALRLEGGALTEPREIRLGTMTVAVAVAGPYAVTLRAATETSATISVVRAESSATTDDRIRVITPAAGQLTTSPLTVTGEARGNWYFEASFPVKLLDANGNVIVSHYATAQGEWMTAEFVPFMSTLTFATPATATGTLVLEKDNPSGLPEHDASVRIPVRFRADDAPAPLARCRPSGCSGQICADQDMVSDCMFRPEYACYRTATCERQADGACGWTQTEALTQCLENPPAIE